METSSCHTNPLLTKPLRLRAAPPGLGLISIDRPKSSLVLQSFSGSAAEISNVFKFLIWVYISKLLLEIMIFGRYRNYNLNNR